MSTQLTCSIGQYSHRGRKASNQDSYGAVVPGGQALVSKGVAVALADGISSSNVSQVASQTSVRSFLEDYYCTSEAWSVKTAALRVLNASNSWLFAQNHRDHEFRLNKDKGYVCTFSALVLKSNTAHILHVGDAQVSRLASATRGSVELLTKAHRVTMSSTKSYLARALGVTDSLEVDYLAIPLQVGDTFLLATDGVYEHVDDELVHKLVCENPKDLNLAAQKIVDAAFKLGSDDNLTVQLVRVDTLPSAKANEFLKHLNQLPFPPELTPRMEFDGYQIIRDLHKSSRSHVVLANDIDSQQTVVLKLPSTEGRQSDEYIERFLMEEWISNRLNNANVVKPYRPSKARTYCYIVSEYVDGQTLAQWITDNPEPNIEAVRYIVEQIASGLQAFHRQEMLHQDLRPENILIDREGTVKIIDFGSTLVSGIEETRGAILPQALPGTAQFLAPEYFLGEFGTKQSDIYSLACITYHMLSGRSPYGTAVARALTPAAQNRLVYQSVLNPHRQLPAWIDLTLKRALQHKPSKRYMELSEFIQDLRKPNSKYLEQSRAPLLERNPVRFWQGVSAVLLGVSIVLLAQLLKHVS